MRMDFSKEQRTLEEIFKAKMAMGPMTVVPKDIRLHSVRDTSKDIVKGFMTHQKTINEIGLRVQGETLNKVIILSIMLVSLITAVTVIATVSHAYAKKSDRQAGYRNGAVDGQKAADAFDAGKSSGVDANNPPPCHSTDSDYCKGYKKGFSDQAIDALE
jgi:hypothetical protein